MYEQDDRGLFSGPEPFSSRASGAPKFLPTALVLVILPALAGGALGAYIGLLVNEFTNTGGGWLLGALFGAFLGAFAVPALALRAWFLLGAWRRPLAPAWITGFPLDPVWMTGFSAIAFAIAVVGAIPWWAIAIDTAGTLLVIVGLVVLLEGMVVLLETYRWRRRRRRA
jgi:hypothetical protein